MTFAGGCAIAIAVLFILFGGCTMLVLAGSTASDDMALAGVGFLILVAGVAIIATVIFRVRARRRTP